MWDPVAGESWVGDAAPWFSPPVLFGATICLTRQAWAARSLAARGGAVARAGGHFVLGLPGTAFHVPRGAHLAVLVRPGAISPRRAMRPTRGAAPSSCWARPRRSTGGRVRARPCAGRHRPCNPRRPCP
ncbi:hypothetical protein ACFQ0M_10175 [Kitasatospora aburaviensis]